MQTNKIVTLLGFQILQSEANVLKDIERQLYLHFRSPSYIDYITQLGFDAREHRIRKIGLYNCGLTTLPESINNLELNLIIP